MKKILPIIILIASILILGSWVNQMLEKTSKAIVVNIHDIKNEITNNQWDQTQTSLKEATRQWKQIQGKWAIFIDHQEIDELDKGFAKLKAYVESREKEEALAELNTLEILFRHIPEKEKVSLVNIF
jgi:hypothetical protein